MSVIVKGGGGKPEEEKTVTAGTSAIEVSPSSGKVMKKVTVNPTPTESKSVTPTTSELTVTPSDGKHLSQVVVGAVEDVTPEVTAQTPVITQILEGLVGKAQGANATADKILEGYSAYVGQELLHGTAKPLDLSAIGCSKIAVGEITFSAANRAITIPHGLGVVPKLAFATRTDVGNKSGVLYMCWYEKASIARLVSDSSSSHYPGAITVDAEIFKADGSSYINFPASTYKWVVMA